MRVAFFSDVHANLPALEAALADARAHGATHLIHLGDAVGYGPQPAECLARLREVASGAVLGNHDAAACGLLDPALFNPFARETAERAALALDAEAKAWLRGLPYILEGDGFACAHHRIGSNIAHIHRGRIAVDVVFDHVVLPIAAVGRVNIKPAERVLCCGCFLASIRDRQTRSLRSALLEHVVCQRHAVHQRCSALRSLVIDVVAVHVERRRRVQVTRIAPGVVFLHRKAACLRGIDITQQERARLAVLDHIDTD